MDRENLLKIRYFASFLADGIDPTSKLKFPEDTVMNSPYIMNYSRDVSLLIDSILGYSNSSSFNGRKIPFFLLESDIEFITAKLVDQNITCFVKLINSVLPKGVKKCRTTNISNQLVKMNYLYFLKKALILIKDLQN